MTNNQTLTFEEAAAKLETIVGKLERGDAPLEEAIELFQEGMALSQLCSSKLEQIEKRVEMLLVNSNGDVQKEPFATGE